MNYSCNVAVNNMRHACALVEPPPPKKPLNTIAVHAEFTCGVPVADYVTLAVIHKSFQILSDGYPSIPDGSNFTPLGKFKVKTVFSV